jgi:hypothetical protein
VGVPTPARDRWRRDQRGRWESTTPVTRTLSAVDGTGQEQGRIGHGGRPGVVGFHLGHWSKGQSGQQRIPAAGGVSKDFFYRTRHAEGSVGIGRGAHEKENPRRPYAVGLRIRRRFCNNPPLSSNARRSPILALCAWRETRTSGRASHLAQPVPGRRSPAWVKLGG